MDGEAIYLSGRSLAKIGSLNKGALTIETANENLSQNLRVIAVLTDAILNDATPKQSQVIYYKLLGYKESKIAEKNEDLSIWSKQPFIFCQVVLH